MTSKNVSLHFAISIFLLFFATKAFAFWGAKFEPADGLIYSGIGQEDAASIMQAVIAGDPNRKPTIIALYKLLRSPSFALGPSILNANNYYPGHKLNLGISLPQHDDAEMKRLFGGDYDATIYRMAESFNNLDQDLFVRFAFEIDGPWNGYNPEFVVPAWQYIVTILNQEGVNNAAYVWNVSDPIQDIWGTTFDWYPGNRFVDWCAVNIWETFDGTWFRQESDARGKPVMICESTRRYSADSYTDWFNDFFNEIEIHGIKGYQYINWNWDTFSNWSDTWDSGKYTEDSVAIGVFNAEMQELKYIHRDSSYYDPLQLAVRATRGAESQFSITGTSWSKMHDEYAAKPGYDYSVVDGLHQYASAFATHWKNLIDTNKLEIEVTAPQGSSGYINLRGYANGTSHSVLLNNQEVLSDIFTWTKKFEYLSTDVINGKLLVAIETDFPSDIFVEEIIIQSVSPNAPVAPGNVVAMRSATGTALSWNAVAGAEMYNIYSNGNLVATSLTNSYVHPVGIYSDIQYRISAWDDHQGEGPMSTIVASPELVLEAEVSDDFSGLSVNGNILSNVTNGSWAKYSGFDFSSGRVTALSAGVSSQNGGTIEVRLDSPVGSQIGSIAIPSGSWSTYTIESTMLTPVEGVHDVYLVFTSSGGYVCNLDWIEFSKGKHPYNPIPSTSLDSYSGLAVGSGILTNIQNGAWALYNDVNFWGEGVTSISVYAASQAGGTIEARLNSPTGILLGSVDIPSGSFGTFNLETGDLSGVSGQHDLYLVFTGSGSFVCDLKWFDFDKVKPVNPFEAISADELTSYSDLTVGTDLLYNIQDGAWAMFEDLDFGERGAVSFDLNVSSGIGGAVELWLDDPINGTQVGTLNVPLGTWGTYTVETATISGVTDIHDLYLVFSSSGTYVCNIRDFTFNEVPTGDPYQQVEAEGTDSFAGLDASGSLLSYVTNGAWAKYSDVDFGSVGAARLEVFACSQNGGTIDVRLDSESGPVLGTVSIPAGAWGNYSIESSLLDPELATGVHDLYLVFNGSGSYVCNLDWLKFYEAKPGYSKIEANLADGYSSLRVGSNLLYEIQDDAWAAYTDVNFSDSGPSHLYVYASSQNGATIEARLESEAGPLIGEVTIPAGSWGEYFIEPTAVASVTGVQDVYLVFRGSGLYACNIKWLKFMDSTL